MIVLAGYLIIAFAAVVALALGLCRAAADGDADHGLKLRTVGGTSAQPRPPIAEGGADTAGMAYPPVPAPLSTTEPRRTDPDQVGAAGLKED